MNTPTRMALPVVLCASLVVACGGSGSTGPGTNPPPGTTARISIQQTTTAPTIYAGDIYGKSGPAALSRVDFTPQDKRCSAQPGPNLCYFDVKVGETVTLVASDVLAEANIGAYPTVNVPDDPRTIQSQFVGFTGPCATPAPGVCTFKATGDQTVTVQYKPLNLTKVNFSGLGVWQFTVVQPDPLGLTFQQAAGTLTTYRSYGVFTIGVTHPRCIGLAPGERCAYILTPDNASIAFDIYDSQSPQPLGSPGPLSFVGWGGACAGSTAHSANTVAACTLSGSGDRTVVIKWEYYRCVSSSGAPYASEGTSSWKIDPTSRILTDNNCVLTQ